MALALVAGFPNDVAVLVAHEPPMNPVLPDAAAAHRARAHYSQTYQAKGHGSGMAAFQAMYAWEGESTDAYFAQPDPDPNEFGLPGEDDGAGRPDAFAARSPIDPIEGLGIARVLPVNATTCVGFAGRGRWP